MSATQRTWTFLFSQIDDALQNVSEFDVSTLFACVSQCLKLITGNEELPNRLPANISTRFKICGELAQLCQVVTFPHRVF